MPSPTTPPSPSTSTPPAAVTAPGLRVAQPPTSQPSTPQPAARPAAVDTAPLDPDPVDSTRSPAGTDTATAVPISKKTIGAFLRDAVGAVGDLAHERFASSPEADAAELWIVTDDDKAQIADPIAAVAASHGIKTMGGSDMANLVAAGIGLAVYVGRNLFAAVAIRLGRARARRAAAATLPVDRTVTQ